MNRQLENSFKDRLRDAW